MVWFVLRPLQFGGQRKFRKGGEGRRGGVGHCLQPTPVTAACSKSKSPRHEPNRILGIRLIVPSVRRGQ